KVSEKAVTETPKVDTTKGNIKEQVASVVRTVLKHYRFCSLGEQDFSYRKPRRGVGLQLQKGGA
ncbi:hypothetical protein, partial [Prevotella intermedia]|uniref:hypothetical protein n=1 Tax=Prevotella intermedia TaxID=28131 RepID=UPI000BE745B4